MKILLWLAAPAALTVLVMLWATWAGRRREQPERLDDEAVSARFQKAIAKPLPRKAGTITRQTPERSSGVAVRRSAPPGSSGA